MNRPLIFIVFCLMILTLVTALEVRYSEPTHEDESKIEWDKSVSEKPIKENITKEEWNQIFEDYRNGEISKEEAVKILKGVEVKW